MHIGSSLVEICPRCGSIATFVDWGKYFLCSNDECNWSTYGNTIDISYKDAESGVLSNLFPNKFFMAVSHDVGNDIVPCTSMEAFLQSLKVKDPTLQRGICTSYTGPEAKKLSSLLSDWKKDGILYWQGKAYPRESKEYLELITQAYDCLFKSNRAFRELVLPKFNGKYLVHTIGSNDPHDTVLTQDEFTAQLTRLVKKAVALKEHLD